jgi:hypothetical protein
VRLRRRGGRGVVLSRESTIVARGDDVYIVQRRCGYVERIHIFGINHVKILTLMRNEVRRGVCHDDDDRVLCHVSPITSPMARKPT